MAMPKEAYIELPLLYEIDKAGGSVHRSDPAVYQAVASHFPSLTADDRRLKNAGSGQNKWENRVQWARFHLAEKGELDKRQRGVWPITGRGRERLQREWPAPQEPEYSGRLYIDTPMNKRPGRIAVPRPEPNGVAPVPPDVEPAATHISPQPSAEPYSESAETTAREAILQKLKEMDDSQFEQFVRRFFAKLGHENLNVETLSEGNGVDAECVLEEPFIGPPVTVVWRVARGPAELGASAVRDLRAAWEDRADRLVLISAGGFARDARQVATPYRGSKPVGLISAKELTDLMILKGIGVSKQTIVVYDLDEQFWGQS